MESQFVTSDYDLSNIRMRKETKGGCTYDLGCYTTSMVGWMTGKEPESVSASGVFSPEGVDVLACAALSFDDGMKALVNSGMVLETNADRRIDQLRIEGSEGSIRSDAPFNGCGELSYSVIRDGNAVEKTISVPQNYRLEVEQFGRCLREGERPHVSKEFTLSNLRTLERILDAIGYN